MPTIPFYQVDAFTPMSFTGTPFTGNPAGVCLCEVWPDNTAMQAVAAEINLAETAFVVPPDRDGAAHGLRWFTPTVEVDLCGHATLASAFVLMAHTPGLDTRALDAVAFDTRSGRLSVTRAGETLSMDFPAYATGAALDPVSYTKALGTHVREAVRAGPFLLAVCDSPETVAALTPDMAAVSALPDDALGVIATASGDLSARRGADRPADFVSRFFAPRAGIPEDPVTGSAHCALAPYWGARLGQPALLGRQVSPRGGAVTCHLDGDGPDARVHLGGACVRVLNGQLYLP